MGWGNGANIDLPEFLSAHKQFFYLYDKQSARLARRLGRPTFAGVPAAVLKNGRTDFEIAQLHTKSYQWITPGQQYFHYQNLQKVIDRVYPEMEPEHNLKGNE